MNNEYPKIKVYALDNLWFQVSGTLCNIACEHCLISCSPTNHNYEFMTLDNIKELIDESLNLGVKEFYFTGGEPFMNKEIIDILDHAMNFGPVTILTNGTLIKESTAEKLAGIFKRSRYSLEIRVSIDGYTEKMNDAIRGEGVFKKAMRSVQLLYSNGFLPIVTVTKTWDDSEDENVLKEFFTLLKKYGYERPRIKILPSIKIGRESLRDKGYDKYGCVYEEMLKDYDVSQFICSNSRVATSKGIAVCPILIDYSDAIMADTLNDSLEEYELKHQACYTCYLYGAICSNFASGDRDA